MIKNGYFQFDNIVPKCVFDSISRSTFKMVGRRLMQEKFYT